MLISLAEIGGNVITEANAVDWVQVLINILVAAATLVALFVAIKNSKDSAEFAKHTLIEDRQNRKDDVRPILQMSSRNLNGNEKDAIYLKNVGTGPLFKFSARSLNSKGLEVANTQLLTAGEIAYYVLVNSDALSEDTHRGTIEYHFQDLYGRKFKQKHHLSIRESDGRLMLSNEVEIPLLQE